MFTGEDYNCLPSARYKQSHSITNIEILKSRKTYVSDSQTTKKAEASLVVPAVTPSTGSLDSGLHRGSLRSSPQESIRSFD